MIVLITIKFNYLLILNINISNIHLGILQYSLNGALICIVYLENHALEHLVVHQGAQ